jgi:hypothetical protein
MPAAFNRPEEMPRGRKGEVYAVDVWTDIPEERRAGRLRYDNALHPDLASRATTRPGDVIADPFLKHTRSSRGVRVAALLPTGSAERRCGMLGLRTVSQMRMTLSQIRSSRPSHRLERRSMTPSAALVGAESPQLVLYHAEPGTQFADALALLATLARPGRSPVDPIAPSRSVPDELGTMDLRSPPGSGTPITCRIPIGS